MYRGTYGEFRHIGTGDQTYKGSSLGMNKALDEGVERSLDGGRSQKRDGYCSARFTSEAMRAHSIRR